MQITKTLTVRNGTEWRTWLEANHDKEQEIWLVYFKPASGKTGIDYETSVEEALCYGWIDSISQKINEEKYVRKFNPRREKSFWSAVNKKRMDKLIAEGRMTPIGLAKYDPNAKEGASEDAQKIRRGEMPIPAEVMQQLESNPCAWENFQRLRPSLQRQYLSWALSAKKVETQQKRLKEVIDTLAEGKQLAQK